MGNPARHIFFTFSDYLFDMAWIVSILADTVVIKYKNSLTSSSCGGVVPADTTVREVANIKPVTGFVWWRAFCVGCV